MKFKKQIFFLLLCLGMIFFPVAARAQDEKEEEVEDILDISLDELLSVSVSGVSKYEQGLDKAPASAVVVTRQQIEDRGYSDLSDLLKDMPGFDIVADAGRFGDYYTMRGIESNDRFLVLVDGHKINPASGTFLSVGNSIALHFAKQVEIIYGPASAVYGADAFSGIINIVSMEAEEKMQLLVQGEVGSDMQRSGAFFIQKKLNPNFSISVMARAYISDGPDFTNRGYDEYDSMVERYPTPLVAEFEQPTSDHTLFAKAVYKNFTLSYFRQHFDEGNSLGMAPAFYVFNEEGKWKMTTDMVWAVYERDLGNGGVLSFDLSYISHVQDPDTQFFKWRVVGQPGATFSQYMTGADRTVRGVVTYTRKFSEKFKLVSGVEYESIRSVPPYANDEVLGNSFKYEGENIGIIKDAMTISENRTAGFAQLTYSPFKTVDVVLGGRYDNSSRYGGTFNQRLGLIYNPTSKTSLKLIYGSAFQAPSLFYQFEQFGIPPFAFRSTNEIKVNEDPSWELDNQRLKTYELYFHQYIGKRLKLTASLYRNNLFDLIERVMYDTTGSTWNKYFNRYTNGQRNENIGKQKIQGANVTLDMALSKNASGYVFYSYTDAAADKNGEDIPIARVAKHKLRAGADIRNIFGYFTLSPRLKWVGDINTAASNSVYKGEMQPGYVNLDVTVSLKKLVKHIRFYAFLGNVFDRKIEHAGLFGQSGVYSPIVPQPEFHFRLGIEYRH
ncbi:MAG: TonB-dependent receptor [bacterium]|nr:TonB-dependent receptor [bacterium]